MRNKIITITFCIILLTSCIFHAVYPDKLYSSNEKRTLQQLPAITLSGITSGRYMKSIEKYLADQIPFRNNWISWQTELELALGKTEINGVYFCNDGYLINQFTSINEDLFKSNINNIKEISGDISDTFGIETEIILVPTQSTALIDKLPNNAPNIDQDILINYAKEQGLNIVDVSSTLKEHADEYIYYKTDHHFTSLGAYYTYQAWKSYNNETADPLSDWNTEELCNDFHGTTYYKVNYPDAEFDTITAYYKTLYHEVNYNDGDYITDSIYERSYLNSKDQYGVFLNSNQATTVIKGSGSENILIIKDSYANTFAQFVIDEYAETHLIDLRFFEGNISDYIAEHNINQVLFLYYVDSFVNETEINPVF